MNSLKDFNILQDRNLNKYINKITANMGTASKYRNMLSTE